MPAVDTAKSRTQPVFQQLYEQDNSGQSWLGPLLALGSRAEELSLTPEAPGALQQPPLFDYSAPPPLDYLEFLVRNPRKLKWPKDADGEPRSYRPSIQQKRKW